MDRLRERQPVTTSLTAANSYSLGDPILITLNVENIGSTTLQVLTWGTPLEESLTANCLRVQRDGETVPYDGILVKRGNPSPEDYVVIRPGETVQSTVDVSTGYSIDQPGNYSVTLDATVFDAFEVPGDAKQPARRLQDFNALELPETTAQFTVVSGGEPKLTAGQAARKESQQQAKSSAKAPNFNGGTATQQSDTVIAHGNAQYFASLSAAQLTAGPSSTNAPYQTWFGAFNQGRYDAVTKNFNDISNTLITDSVTYDLTGTGCKPSWFAYTTNGSRTVWLCNNYLTAAQIGTDCKFGTLVHEWSHAVSGTDDHQYGRSNCQTLATNDPAKAIDNADSHEYFAEDLAQSDFGKSFTFITDRSTFGRDEIDAMLSQTAPAVIEKAFYVVADGFWPDRLGITAATLGSTPSVRPTIAISPSIPGMSVTVTSLEAEDTTLPIAPQRFTWVYRIAFSNNSGFPTTAGQVTTVTLTASLGGLSSSAQIQLIREPNPYELDGPISWLSTDVRVFQIRAGDSRFGATIGSTAATASTFVKQVVANLNAGSAGGQTFESISTDPQTSVLELASQVNGTKVFNFAVAKVRYRGTIDISNVRVFFRLFPAATTSTVFDANTTYRRAVTGTNTIPLLGLSSSGDLLTIPCFAEPRVNSASVSTATQTDPANVRTIPHASGGNEAAAYFGCWLDINQTPLQFPVKPAPSDGPWSTGRKSIQELMRNAHQCLVAEIAFDPDPILAGASPASSDKLAQRNLAIVESANPGDDTSRRILSTFDMHPPRQDIRIAPDELMIEWGNTPPGSLAAIYIPEVDASHIIALADARYSNHVLTQIDDQTIELPVGGISYIPLPPGAVFGLTGLLSIDLPNTVRKGEAYTIVVHQISDAPPVRVPSEGEVIRKSRRPVIPTHGEVDLIRWRQIIGSYQITIPVRSKEVILPRETRLLSVLRWILSTTPENDRWYPVFSRYVGLIGERVGALGGHPDLVAGSPEGTGGELFEEPVDEFLDHGERLQHTDGKITGLIYDCFGDFEGFVLDDCRTEIKFRAREHRIEALARTAWRKRIAITVVTDVTHRDRPLSIIFRRAPEPFQS